MNSPPLPRRQPDSRQRGTTLLEALIAIVVLSIGLLGMAGLQVNALKLNQTSMQRSQASFLAYAILDQMRADSAAAKEGTYDLALAAAAPEGSALEDWRADIVRALGPGASGAVCRAAEAAKGCSNEAGDEMFRITLQWSEASIADRTDQDGEKTVAGGTRELTVVGRL